ncbi:MAG: TonB-dependent receptor, partial [Algicola sp.]|nr:TonB-dependent receptor [Algicola sp.]
NHIQSQGFSATIELPFETVDFVSITDYKKFDRLIGLDGDATASPELIFQSNSTIKQWSEELRISGDTDNIKWVAGAYYLKIDTYYHQGLAASPQSNFYAGEENNTLIDMKTDSYSVFGQMDYDVADGWVLVSGLRYVRENKSFVGNVYHNANTDDRVIEIDESSGSSETADLTNDQDLWSFKVQMEYTSDEDSLYYFGINRGVKAGSFNAPLFGGFNAYKPEKLQAYEAGMKLTLLDGRAQLNGSVYYYDYTDFQSFSWVNNTSVVTNEKANFSGSELELYLTPTNHVDIIFGVSYTDAKVKNLEVADGVFRDTRSAYTPEYKASGLIRYNWDIAGGNMSTQLSGSYQSDFYHNARNFTAHRVESHFVSNAMFSWNDNQDVWSAKLFVNNLFDSDHGIIGFDVSGFYGNTLISHANPRTYGLTVRRNF